MGHPVLEMDEIKMTYNCLVRILLPGHDPGQLELEEGYRAAGVHHGVVVVVGGNDEVIPVNGATGRKTEV